MSIYYYGKLMGSIYSKKSGDRLFMNGYIVVAVIVCLTVVIVFGLYPEPIINAANVASLSLFGI
jgi:NADH:ubiquinone oxidoreductase subunit 2 (subunit N)